MVALISRFLSRKGRFFTELSLQAATLGLAVLFFVIVSPSLLFAEDRLLVKDASETTQFVVTDSGFMGLGTDKPTRRLDIAGDRIRIRTPKSPASSTASCKHGDISWDPSYVYVCVAKNTWKRAALSSW